MKKPIDERHLPVTFKEALAYVDSFYKGQKFRFAGCKVYKNKKGWDKAQIAFVYEDVKDVVYVHHFPAWTCSREYCAIYTSRGMSDERWKEYWKENYAHGCYA